MKLIIDTDPGVDDALAIALAHALPQIELLGLTTIFGNTFVHQSSRNARYILNLLGVDLPVAEGAALPFGATDYTPSKNVHGDEGLGDLTDIPEVGTNASEDAADYLIRVSRTHGAALTVCAIGPLTNIAEAVRRDPDFATRIGRLVIMGGNFDCPGNITPESEANIYHDIQAADEVFAAGFDLVMVGLDATMKTLLTDEDFVMMQDASSVGGFIHDISQFYLGFYRSIGVEGGCAMHDSTAILACCFPEKFEFSKSGLAVDASGRTIPQADRPVARIAINLDAEWAVETAKAAVFGL